jgi:hypothetical protein
MGESGLLPPGTHEKIRRAAASQDPRQLRTALRRLAGWFGRDPAPGSEAAVRAAAASSSSAATAADGVAALDRALLDAVRDPKSRTFFNIAHLKMATVKGYHDPWARKSVPHPAPFPADRGLTLDQRGVAVHGAVQLLQPLLQGVVPGARDRDGGVRGVLRVGVRLRQGRACASWGGASLTFELRLGARA